jgi:hypothetical protein
MMTQDQTPLDAIRAALNADPENDALRLRFYDCLADGEMLLLLEREPEGETMEPRIFDLESGPMVLVFDREDRLSAFTGGVSAYAALPGRVIAGLLAGQGIGLGINLGVEASELLLPSEAMDWLAQTLDEAPEEAEGRPETFYPPKGLPESLLSALDAKLARAGGLAQGALLASVTYQGGRRGHLLAFVGAKAAAQEALARAVSEALVFSGVEAGEMDVVFLAPEDAATAAMARVALRFDLAQPEAPVKPAPTAPGMDPNRPPRLI